MKSYGKQYVNGKVREVITKKTTVSLKTDQNQLELIVEESNHNSTKGGKMPGNNRKCAGFLFIKKVYRKTLKIHEKRAINGKVLYTLGKEELHCLRSSFP